jgi:hypothetical protein
MSALQAENEQLRERAHDSDELASEAGGDDGDVTKEAEWEGWDEEAARAEMLATCAARRRWSSLWQRYAALGYGPEALRAAAAELQIESAALAREDDFYARYATSQLSWRHSERCGMVPREGGVVAAGWSLERVCEQ